MTYRKTAVRLLSAGLALTCAGAHAATVTTTGNNITLVSAAGVTFGGTNDIEFTWDGSVRFSVVTDGSSNASLVAPTGIDVYLGTIKLDVAVSVHNVNIYGPGSYTFYTDCAAGNPACPSGTTPYNVAVGAGQLAIHALLDLTVPIIGPYTNVDAVNVWARDQKFAPSNLWPLDTKTADPWSGDPNHVWSLMSTDIDGNGINGIGLLETILAGSSANLNVNWVPLPAGAWLLAPALLGLLGFARRRA